MMKIIIVLMLVLSLFGCTSSDIKKDEISRNEYVTKFSKVNNVTYPSLSFTYPKEWSITKESVSDSQEVVELTDNNGANIIYIHYDCPEDYSYGSNCVAKLRVNISKTSDSMFVPGNVQGSDYSKLRMFMVANIKVIGILEKEVDLDYKEKDGIKSYAILPQAMIGTYENITGLFTTDFSFYYSGRISFICEDASDLSKKQTEQVIEIMKSFKVNE